MLFFFMLVTLLLGWKLTNVTIVAVIFASYLTLAVIIFIFMKIEMVLMIKAGLKNIFMPLSADNAWLKVSSRLIANTMVFKILSVSDLIIVLLLVKSGLEVGHYAAVLMIISSIWLIPQNLYREVKPKISSLIETAHGRAQLQEKLDRVNIVVFPVIFSLCIVIICFSKTFLSHFGPSYLSANPALIILTIGVSFSATLHIASVLLTYAGFERLILILNCVELLMMIVLVIPATYFFNITGTAAATAFVMCTKSIIAVYAVRKHLGLRPASLF